MVLSAYIFILLRTLQLFIAVSSCVTRMTDAFISLDFGGTGAVLTRIIQTIITCWNKNHVGCDAQRT